MGKAKKGRKVLKAEDSDSEAEVDTQEQAEKASSTKGKPPKPRQAPNDSDEETSSKKSDASRNPTAKSRKSAKEANDSDESDDGDLIPTVSRTQKSFALLQAEDSDTDEDEPQAQQNSDSDSKPAKKDLKKKANKNSEESRTSIKEQGSKKGKKSRRKRDDSDEDIEKVLAELELEYTGSKKGEIVASTQPEENEEPPTEEPEKKKKTKKKKQQPENEPLVKPPVVENETQPQPEDEITTGTVKTAAQKKKEKKEREKQKRLEKKSEVKNQESVEEAPKTDVAEVADNQVEAKPTEGAEEDHGDEEEKAGKKKKKKGAAAKEEKDAKKGPGKKTISAMQEALKKLKEEQEKQQREEEERIRREEEAEQARLEALRLEQERKEKKKQKEKERKERLKAEGKLLTAKQKADRARAQALIDSLKAQGVELPDVGVKKPRLGTRVKKPSKQQKEQNKDEGESTPKIEDVSVAAAVKTDAPKEEDQKETTPPTEKEKPEESEEDVKDAWDASSSEGEEESEENTPSSEAVAKAAEGAKKKPEKKQSVEENSESDADESDEESDSEESGDSDEDDSEEEENDGRSLAEKARARVLERIASRKEAAEKAKSLDNLRAAIVCVLGHVDTGKTKILDKLRRTNVQDGEAGGITQQIGATNVPIDAIKEQIKIVKGANEMNLKIPGLLIIDTPGHESFSNLRSRGSSLCDIAVLVVDIMHGLEPQTIESINLLKSRKTPFLVALNKIDRLYDWQTMNRKDVRDIIKGQANHTQLEFQDRCKQIIVQFAEQGLNAALFYENPDERSYVSLVPTSAITGEGMGNLLALIVEFCQTKLPKRLMYSDELQATVLEVKAIPGLGTTIDVILVNGTLREGDTMLCAGTDGAIVTQIRSLLMPQPMRELRVKNAYIEYKEIKAAQGVKIAAKDLEKAIAGLNLFIAHKPDEVDILKEDVTKELKSALSNIKLQERGVYVQASTLGSLEALLEFLRTSKIPYSNIRIGPVVKKDVMKASTMLEHDSQYATILAFDVKIERDAQDLADTMGVKIFQADIIYHLFDKFIAYRDELKQKKREEFKHIAVFPCKLKILPQFIFNSRDPIVVGVMVEAGIVKEGTPLCVPSQEFVDIGVVTSIESNHKSVESARKGMEVCIKIEPIPGEAPKMVGRHFEETDMLVSKISRQSIDACKNYFRDDLMKTDWQLMVELKKLFEIL